MNEPAFTETRRRGRPPRMTIHGEAPEPSPPPHFQPSPQEEPPVQTEQVQEPESPPAAIPSGWFDLDGAPDDGKAVWLLDLVNKVQVEAVWRNTRWFDPRGGKWRIRGYWAVRNMGGKAVEFTPHAWKPV